MIYNVNFVEILVNGKKLELENQESLGIRMNAVITDPTKIASNQGEYSYEFELPATPYNNTIFDYANNLSKLNKFHQRYNAEVYADGSLIFTGSLTINSFKDKKYKVNLVSVKVYSLEDIFGDDTMDKIKGFTMPFDGVDTINARNAMLDTEVVFPFVSYGAFQKSPYNQDDVAKDYTSKYDLDEYNRWYVESFPPSANMLATVRHAFEYKGYAVGGDVFQNTYLKDIYLSTNLADGQIPEYNVGNPRFGAVELSTQFTTANRAGYGQELHFPYYCVYAKESTTTFDVEKEYNFKDIELHDLLDSGGTVTVASPSYMYQPNEHIIVIPADGFYKIEMSVSSKLNTAAQFTAAQYTRYNQAEEDLEEEDLTLTPGFDEITPIEIALVKNYDDNYELIKGKNNTEYIDGNPNDETAWGRYDNQVSWQTCYPHEDPYSSTLPTEKNDLSFKNTNNRMGGQRTEATNRDSSSSSSDSEGGGRMGGQRSRTRGGTIDPEGGGRRWSYTDYGYIYNDGEVMCYDQAVSQSFVCGFSSLKGGTVAVMKNGYSWSKSNATQNESFYPEIGYSKLYREEGTGNIQTEQTRFNENTYINTPISRISVTNDTMDGNLSCMVYLHKNDILQLYAVHRGYHTVIGNPVRYSTTSNVTLKISAASPRHYDSLKASHGNRYDAPTEFDVDLNIANFFNNETKISDWVQNVADAYNLEILQNGKTVDINTRKKLTSNILAAVDIDDRTNYSEVEASNIDYPKSMAVKYKIDLDEWGAERSAVEAAGGDESILNDDDEWKKLVDSGYTIIKLNDDAYATSTSDKDLQFSYTWYQKFDWYTVSNKFKKTSTTPRALKIPCISKYSYMIDGYDYTESMKHDGYSLSQRFWFKPKATGCYVWTRTYPVEMVMLYEPKNLYTNYRDIYLNLSYKDTEESILTKFFNVNAYLASNYVEVEVYLTPDEYNRIRNGSLIHFDEDLYMPISIDGYDPTGSNQTTLKMMKKIN